MKTIKRLFMVILILFICNLVLYPIISFINLDFNLFNWSKEQRLCFSILNGFVFIIVLVSVVLGDILSEGENKKQ